MTVKQAMSTQIFANIFPIPGSYETFDFTWFHGHGASKVSNLELQKEGKTSSPSNLLYLFQPNLVYSYKILKTFQLNKHVNSPVCTISGLDRLAAPVNPLVGFLRPKSTEVIP